jgi:Protein of unknown function (DUF3168)
MAVLGGIFNYLTQSPAPGAVAVQKLLATLPPVGATPQYSVYFSLAEKQAPRPFVVMHLIEGLPAGETLDGVSELTDGEFQFDCYADDQVAARALSQAVRDALKNFAGALNDGTTIQFYSVALDADDPYELGGGGYVYRSVLRLRAFYTEAA